MEVRALLSRFVWRGVNIDDVTIHPSRGSRIKPTLKVCEHNRVAHASPIYLNELVYDRLLTISGGLISKPKNGTHFSCSTVSCTKLSIVFTQVKNLDKFDFLMITNALYHLHIFSTKVESLQRFRKRVIRRLSWQSLQLLMKRENQSLFHQLVCSVFHEK